MVLQLDVDHLVRRRRRYVNAGAGKWNEQELSNFIRVVFKRDHESGNGDKLVVECAGGRTGLG